MGKTMKITVTKEDIDESRKTFYNGCRHGPCPIEHAFRRNGIDVSVGTSIMHVFGDFLPDKFSQKPRFKQMSTPKEFGNFPYDFDRDAEFRRNCKPFSFEFEMPK